MNYEKVGFALNYDPLDQQVVFDGILRLGEKEEASDVLGYLKGIYDQLDGQMTLDFQRLRYINAFSVNHVLIAFIQYAKEKKRIKIFLIASSILAWTERVLPGLCSIWEEVDYKVYDQGFYGSQGIIEGSSFIPLLREQTRILWPLEKEVLKKHGLKKGMRVADICCGCGDASLLIAREFEPSYLWGVDHSESSIAYARELQKNFAVRNVEFSRGDATSLLIEDNSFDFVLSRLSLQIFSQPLLILKELMRITRPGGRVYIICEDYDLVVGYPENESIRNTYRLAAEYSDRIGMDMRSGKKLYSMLTEVSLKDIRVDHLNVDTNNVEREGFAKVIKTWKEFFVESVGNDVGISPEEKVSLAEGYEAQLRAIDKNNAYTNWSIIVSSGEVK